MVRVARVVAPGIPHHITQRGNRRQPTFFRDEDFMLYRSLLREMCHVSGVEIWAYCFMPNHVHLVLVPPTVKSLRQAVSETHRRYTTRINQREGWTGHLWQGRFFSYPMDQSYLLHAVRYIELNPVRAGLSVRPEDYLWCSARARILGKKDRLITTTVFDDVRTRALLASATVADEEADRFRAHERSGLPLGSSEFIQDLEKQLNTNLQRHKCGRPRKKLTQAGGESAEGNNRLHDEVRPSAGG